MQIIGTVVCFIMLIIYVIPPLSPLLIPSTSSIIIKFFTKPEVSWIPIEFDSSKATPFLLRMSLALNSITL